MGWTDPTVDTTGQPGGAAGGTSVSGGSAASGGSAGSAASGDDGGLAETGAGDHGALKALGLVAGTAILLGAAVFTYMPRRRSR